MYLARPLWSEPHELEHVEEAVDHEGADPRELDAERVEEGGREDRVPGLALWVVVERSVACLDDFEADCGQRAVAVFRRHHLGQPVALLNQLLGQDVLQRETGRGAGSAVWQGRRPPTRYPQ